MDFQRNKTKRKERMKNGEIEPSGQWALHMLWYPGGKTGESIVPLGLQNNTIKRGGRIAKERGIFGDKRIVENVQPKRKLREN